MRKSQTCKFCRGSLPDNRDETCGAQCEAGLRSAVYQSLDFVKRASQKLMSFMGPITPKNAVGYCLLSQCRTSQFPAMGRTKRADGVYRVTPFFYLSPIELPCVPYSGGYIVCWYFPDGTILESNSVYYVEKEFTRTFSSNSRKAAKHTANVLQVRRPSRG